MMEIAIDIFAGAVAALLVFVFLASVLMPFAMIYLAMFG